MRNVLIICLLFLLVASPVMAQMNHEDMESSDMQPSTKAFTEAGHKMHENMSMAYTGDADKDFITGMIPHHQGAIDMAKVELQYGTNPQIRKLAKDIIKAQTAEIKMMNQWMKKHGEQ